MKTLVFSIGLNGYDIGYRTCLDSQREYADRIGADFRVVTKPTVSNPAFAAWLKITILTAALKAGYDAVAYIDADCRVSKEAPDFTTELAKAEGKLCMSLGRSGRLNSGVIFAENSETSTKFLDRVVASVVEDIPVEARANLRFENGNIIYVESVVGGVHIIDSRWNNSSDASMDDHIRHYTGPLKSNLKAPLLDRLQFRIRKLFLPRASAAPERREASFLTELQELTDSIVRGLDLNTQAVR